MVALVTGFPGQQQFLVTFMEGATVNLRGQNLNDLAFGTQTAASEVTGTQGGLTGVETLAAATTTLTLNMGVTAPSVSLAAGTTLALGSDLVVGIRPGVPATAAGVTLSGPGNLSLLAPVATANAIRTFTVADGPAANDLNITAPIIDGSVGVQSQTLTLAAAWAFPLQTGSFDLSGGPLTGTVTIPANSTATQVQRLLAAALPAGVTAVVTFNGTIAQTAAGSGTIYTITFFGLTSGSVVLSVTNNTVAGPAVAITPAISAFAVPAGSLTKAGAISRMALNNPARTAVLVAPSR